MATFLATGQKNMSILKSIHPDCAYGHCLSGSATLHKRNTTIIDIRYRVWREIRVLLADSLTFYRCAQYLLYRTGSMLGLYFVFMLLPHLPCAMLLCEPNQKENGRNCFQLKKKKFCPLWWYLWYTFIHSSHISTILEITLVCER